MDIIMERVVSATICISTFFNYVLNQQPDMFFTKLNTLFFPLLMPKYSGKTMAVRWLLMIF